MNTDLFQALALGFIQGLTEFIPVSSSGHLAIAQNLFPNFQQPGILLDVLLHLGTLAAVIVYFRRDLVAIARAAIAAATRKPEREPADTRLIIGIIIAAIPTGIIGLLIQDTAEAMFSSLIGVGIFLITTAAAISLGEIIAPRVTPRTGPPSPLAALLIGIAQGIAVFPGISRSGATISAARALGVSGDQAARFSFLASIPPIAGAALLSIIKHHHEIAAFSTSQIITYTLAPLTAAITGYIAIVILMRVIQKNRLIWFAPYCAILGAAVIIYKLTL